MSREMTGASKRLQTRMEELEETIDRGAALFTDQLLLFKEMLETVPVGVIIADKSGRILYGNRAMEKLLGHPVILSQNVDDYGEWKCYHADGRRVESHEYPLSRILGQGVEAATLEVQYEKPDNSRFWIKVIGKAICNDANERIGASVAVIDIDSEHRAQQMQELMIRELSHRVKNAFSVTQAIAHRTLLTADVGEDIRSELNTRLQAYADAHSRLVGTTLDRTPLKDVVGDTVGEIATQRIRITGPDIDLLNRTGLSLSMALYELATNAVKHGSLSENEGHIDISWAIVEIDGKEHVQFRWQETGGPSVEPADHTGFGSFILKRAVAAEIGGKAELRFDAEGLFWQLSFPVEGNIHDE